MLCYFMLCYVMLLWDVRHIVLLAIHALKEDSSEGWCQPTAKLPQLAAEVPTDIHK